MNSHWQIMDSTQVDMGGETILLDGKKVLIVDDDEALVSSLGEFLADEGFDVKIKSYADTLLEELYDWKPDIILMDIWLPGERGDDIAASIKSSPLFEGIPIVLMSASNTVGQRAQLAQAEAFLEKPFNLNEVSDLLGRLLASSHSSVN